MDVVRPAAREDVTDLLAGYQCRCLPTDLSRSQPDRSSFGQIGFNLDMRQVGLQRGMRVVDPRDVADPLLDGLGLLLQLREVGPVNAHHDGLAAPVSTSLMRSRDRSARRDRALGRTRRRDAPRQGSCRNRQLG